MATETSEVESPSGKGAGDENFPVGSFLLPAKLRPHVEAFYAYARAIDDIADNPARTAADRIFALERFEAAIHGQDRDPALAKAHRMRESLEETGITAKHCTDLISAFKQDAVKLRYGDWAELVDYCDRSASPVGRYLLDLHDEDSANYVYSDALCNLLQVINHLQDCQADYRALDRVYLPLEWLEAEGETVAALDAGASSPGLRRVLDRTLDATEDLMIKARLLPGRLSNRRLACESAVIVGIADRLIRLLRQRDPVAGRIELSRLRFLACGISGVAQVFFGRRR